jgi:hypothetical protein
LVSIFALPSTALFGSANGSWLNFTRANRDLRAQNQIITAALASAASAGAHTHVELRSGTQLPAEHVEIVARLICSNNRAIQAQSTRRNQTPLRLNDGHSHSVSASNVQNRTFHSRGVVTIRDPNTGQWLSQALPSPTVIHSTNNGTL